MRETFSHRDAHVRALLVISAGFLISNCSENIALADDASVETLSTPPPPHHFGDKGDVVIPMLAASIGYGLAGGPQFSAAGFSLQYSEYPTGGDATLKSTLIAFAPSADFFVARHWSIGGQASFLYLRQTADSADGSAAITSATMTVGLAPRIGYAIPLGDHVTLWPRLMIGGSAAGNFADSGPMPVSLMATADLPVIYSFDRHFFVSIAPSVTVAGNPKYGIYDSAISTAFQSVFRAGFVL